MPHCLPSFHLENSPIRGSPVTPQTWAQLISNSKFRVGTPRLAVLVFGSNLRPSWHLAEYDGMLYKATKHIHLNRYTILPVREGMIYFIVILVTSLLSQLYSKYVIPMDGGWILPLVALYVPPITLVPRFILGLRALYARDLQGRHGGAVDTAFGLSSGSDHGTAASAIVFADVGKNEGEEQGEEIQMVDGSGGDHGAGSSV